jgi:hypothetical protein
VSSMMGDSIRRRQGRRTPRSGAGRGRSRASGPRFGWGRWLAGGFLVCVAAFAGGWIVAVSVIFPPPPESVDTVPVPLLVGRPIADAERLVADAGLVLESTTEMPHRSRAEGVVVAQSPLAGQHLRPGDGVRLAISSGPPRARVPDLVGLPADGAASVLARAGFQVLVEEELSEAQPGRVVRMEPGAGREYQVPARITLFVSAGPAPPEGDSLPFDAESLPAGPSAGTGGAGTTGAAGDGDSLGNAAG